jgi:L-lactate dehydrogenase complex protein LldE
MTIGLFIPCYVNQLYPDAAIATLLLLQNLGIDMEYPPKQTCCGQPMANSGFEHLTEACNDHFIENFSGFDYIVAPSASCVLHVKQHLLSHGNSEQANNIRRKVYELQPNKY